MHCMKEEHPGLAAGVLFIYSGFHSCGRRWRRALTLADLRGERAQVQGLDRVEGLWAVVFEQ